MLYQLAYLRFLFLEMEVWCNRSPSSIGFNLMSVRKTLQIIAYLKQRLQIYGKPRTLLQIYALFHLCLWQVNFPTNSVQKL